MSGNVVIVGGGVIGLSTAFYCLLAGRKVTVLERLPAQRDGCSFGNAGMIVPSHFVPLAAPGMVALGLKWMWNSESPFYVKPRLDTDLLYWAWQFWRASTAARVRQAAPVLRDLSLASRALFEELATKHDLEFGLEKRGLLMLCRTEHALAEEARMAARANELGLPAEVLDARQAAEREPGARLDVAGAVYFPRDCHLTPERFVHALQRRLVEMGGEFLANTEVTGWRRSGAQLIAVETSAGAIEADGFVLSGGSWSPGIARGLGLNLPLQAGKGYSVTLPSPRRLPSICSILTEARVAVTPMGAALRVGGTMEISGLNEEINPARVRGLVRALQQYYPDFRFEDFDGLPAWRGLRPVSPDGLPYLGRTRSVANLVIATGHAMMGLSLAPVTGKIVADVLDGRPVPYGPNLLDPDRYG